MAEGLTAPKENPTIPETPDPTPKGPPPKEKAPGGNDWQNALNDVKEKRDKWKEKAKTYEGKLAEFERKENERLAKDKEAQDKQQLEQLEAQGKYQEALKTVEGKAATKIEGVRVAVANKLIPMAIRSAAAAIANLAPDSVNDLPSLLGGKIGIDAETLDLFVKGEDGKPMTDEKLNLIPVEKYISDFVNARPYLLVDGMPKAHGQSPGKGGKTVGVAEALANKELYDQWQKEDPEGLKAAETAYWHPKAVAARMKAAGKK